MKKKLQKAYLVSLLIKHPKKNLADISKTLRLPFSNGSCNKGDLIIGKKRAKETVWIYAIDSLRKATIDRCIERLIYLLSRSSLKATKPIPRDWKARLDIAVLYRTYTCSIEIQEKHLKWFSDRRIGLSISCYPTSP